MTKIQDDHRIDRQAVTPTSASRRIITQHKTVFNKPPEKIPSSSAVDGPLLGNGDMGAALGGFPEAQYFILCKNDLWRLQHGYGNSSPVPFGQLTINIPALEGASYKVTQDLYTATTKGVFEQKGTAVHMNSYVAATRNLLIIELVAISRPFEVNVALRVAEGRGSDSKVGREKGVFWGRRAFTKEVDIPSGAAVAWKIQGGGKQTGAGSFELKPNEPVIIILAMESLFKTKHYTEEAINAVSDLSGPDLTGVRRAHEQWWAAYWAKSYVSLNDPIGDYSYLKRDATEVAPGGLLAAKPAFAG